jgi:HAD superfamily hydrolase (TIGR01458 family)
MRSGWAPRPSRRATRAEGRRGVRAPVICLDIDGTLTDGVAGPALPGAAEAVARLRARWAVRLVTNTTSVPHRALADHLMGLELLDAPASLVTPARVARRVLGERGHVAGILFAEPAAREDYAWFREDPEGPAVLLATEGHALRIAELQPAFRRLLEGATLYTMQRNRYFRRDGALVTDLGPLAAFLAYASGREAETLGKPSPLLFDAVASEAGARREELVMVGDDVEFDVAASVSLGMRGVLVRTGKYRAGDEARVTPGPTAVLASVRELAAWLERA